MSSQHFSNDYENSSNSNDTEERTTDSQNNNSQQIRCPECNSENIIRIVYGYPGHELFERARRGEVKLGGCCIRGNDPRHHCKDCQTSF